MTILGIDYGLRKLGLAILDETAGIAQPLCVIHPNQINDWLNQNMTKHSISSVVIGLPGNTMDKSARELGEKIKLRFSLPISFYDETLTTQDAQNVLRDMKVNRTKAKKMEDAVAAAVMLQSYIERGKHD